MARDLAPAARQGNQLEHALQSAWQAEKEDAGAPLITAALLHDIGHLIHKLGIAAERGIDDRHEDLGEKLLRKWFGEDVVRPVALHVDAKRFLCTAEEDYFGKLSAGSVRSLELQGGPFTDEEAEEFIAQPGAPEAVRLRRWDEGAKVQNLETPALAHFRPYVEACLRPEVATAKDFSPPDLDRDCGKRSRYRRRLSGAGSP